MRFIAISLGLSLLVGCARSEDASTVPSDTNGLATLIEGTQSDDSDDDVLAIGEWRLSPQDDSQALEFGPNGAAALFSLRCGNNRGLVLQRHGAAPPGELPVMVVTVDEESRRLAVTSGTGAIPMQRANLAAGDPFIAAIRSGSSGMTNSALFSVRVGDSPPLNLPPSPAIGEFISNCASGDGQPAGDDAGDQADAPAEVNSADAAASNQAGSGR